MVKGWIKAVKEDMWRHYFVFPAVTGITNYIGALPNNSFDRCFELNRFPREFIRESLISKLPDVAESDNIVPRRKVLVVDVGAGEGCLGSALVEKSLLTYIGHEPEEVLRDHARDSRNIFLKNKTLREFSISSEEIEGQDIIICTAIATLEHCGTPEEKTGASAMPTPISSFTKEISEQLKNLSTTLNQTDKPSLCFVATLNQEFFLPFHPIEDCYTFDYSPFHQRFPIVSEQGWDRIFGSSNFHVIDSFLPDIECDPVFVEMLNGVNLEVPSETRDYGPFPFRFWLLRPRDQLGDKARKVKAGEILEYAGSIPSRVYTVQQGKLALQKNILPEYSKLLEGIDDYSPPDKEETYSLYFEEGYIVPTFEFNRCGYRDRIHYHITCPNNDPNKKDGALVDELTMDSFAAILNEPHSDKDMIPTAFIQSVRLAHEYSYLESGRRLHGTGTGDLTAERISSVCKNILPQLYSYVAEYASGQPRDTVRLGGILIKGMKGRANTSFLNYLMWLRASGVLDFYTKNNKDTFDKIFNEELNRVDTTSIENVSEIVDAIHLIKELSLKLLGSKPKNLNSIEKSTSLRVNIRSIRYLYGLAAENEDLYGNLFIRHDVSNYRNGFKPISRKRASKHTRLIIQEATYQILHLHPAYKND